MWLGLIDCHFGVMACAGVNVAGPIDRFFMDINFD